VPPQSRYQHLIDNSRQANVGDMLNKALSSIETANTSLYDVLEHINFTRRVWLRVERAMPDYTQRKAWLAEHGIDVEGI